MLLITTAAKTLLAASENQFQATKQKN